jgi:hypothetical protein
MSLRPLFILLLLLLSPPPLSAGTVEGRVVLGDHPRPGMQVAAYPSLDFRGEPAAVAPTAADGRFRMELAPGAYAFFARDEAGRLFAFCGRNPVTVGEAAEWVGLQAVAVTAPAYRNYDDATSAAVEGVVLCDGKPLEGAHVYLYLDAADDLKGQGYRLSPPTGSDGAFAFDGLPESSYFLAARKREGGGRVGPVREGDYLAVYPGNPLRAVAGKVARVELAAVRKVREAAASETFGRPDGPVLRGTVTDRRGHPVAGVHVFAYTDRVIGHQRPAAISAPTGPDGVYSVSFRAPGTFYVGARQLYGDSPAPGELFGMYEATADHGLTLAAGETLEGVRITVEPIDLN